MFAQVFSHEAKKVSEQGSERRLPGEGFRGSREPSAALALSLQRIAGKPEAALAAAPAIKQPHEPDEPVGQLAGGTFFALSPKLSFRTFAISLMGMKGPPATRTRSGTHRYPVIGQSRSQWSPCASCWHIPDVPSEFLQA
jgi:hypothetical protein